MFDPAGKTLQEKLHYIYGLKPFQERTPANGREDFLALLNAMGDPHLHLPPVIHVAGTNGKGSAIAFMRAILQATGYSVHVFTSPHLVRFNERIVLNNTDITDALLESLLDEALQKNGNRQQTFFSFVTAIAFSAFARNPADLLLLETGVGGRCDNTNVIEDPLVTAITTLSYDHTHVLGTELSSIASEKAGIVKQGIPCIVGSQILPEAQTQAWPVIIQEAAEKQAALYMADRDWHVIAHQSGGFSIQHSDALYGPYPAPDLHGAHQIGNAATAIMILKAQGLYPVSDAHITAGLRDVHWPGRLQKLPLDIGPQWDIWLDGAHNDTGGVVLARQMETWQAAGLDVHIIHAALAKKNPQAMLEPVAPLAASVIPVIIPDDACYPPYELADLWRKAGCKTVHLLPDQADWRKALEHVRAHVKGGVILITGSLHLVGQVLGELEQK